MNEIINKYAPHVFYFLGAVVMAFSLDAFARALTLSPTHTIVVSIMTVCGVALMILGWVGIKLQHLQKILDKQIKEQTGVHSRDRRQD